MGEMLVRSGIAFGRNFIGIITRPYETYRRISSRSAFSELVYIGCLLAVYFTVAAAVKAPVFRPYFLTRQFVLLAAGAGSMFLFSVYLFWQAGRLLGSDGDLKGVVIGWAYSMIPTCAWFWMTSLLFVILPPPRTTRPAGILFSVIYLLVSAVLLYWKIICAYLTLRFGLRLDLRKNIIVCAIVLPVLALYSYGMYRIGIFRIPFI